MKIGSYHAGDECGEGGEVHFQKKAGGAFGQRVVNAVMCVGTLLVTSY